MTLPTMNGGFRSLDAFQHLPYFSVKRHALGRWHKLVREAIKESYFEIFFQILQFDGESWNRQLHQAGGSERAPGADGKIKCI